MLADYDVRLLDWDGKALAQLTDWTSLTIEHTLNGFSTHQLTLPDDNTIIGMFKLDTFLLVKRRTTGQPQFYQEYLGFHRTPQRQLESNSRETFQSYGRSPEDLLHARIIDYPAGSVQASKSLPAESAMKQYVLENVGSSATVPPRLHDGVTVSFHVAPDFGNGPMWTGTKQSINVLDVLQEIAKASKVDFYVLTNVDPIEFIFITINQRGMDRSSYIRFGAEFGNAKTVSYTYSRTEEVNAIIIAGQGNNEFRDFEEVKDAIAINASPWNRRELYRDQRQEDSNAGLISQGQTDLAAMQQAAEKFVMEVLQVPTLQYGRDYFLGDYVTLKHKDIIRKKRIIGVRLNITSSGENIVLTFADV